MTRDEMIAMAFEAKLNSFMPFLSEDEAQCLERFATIAYEAGATAEREACAKVCEEHHDGLNMLGGAFATCANAIRARGDQSTHESAATSASI